MTLQTEIAQAMQEQRDTMRELDRVPVDEIRPTLERIEERYRIIYRQITDRYLKLSQSSSAPEGRPADV